MLSAVIANYHKADQAFRAACNADAELTQDHDVEWNAKEAAEYELIACPCTSLDDIRSKVQLVLSDENVYDSVRNCHYGEGNDVLRAFLLSLLDTSPVDKSNNGENSL